MTSQPRGRDEGPVPDPCQILRGTTGNTGESTDPPAGGHMFPPQVSPHSEPKSP